MPRPSPTPAPAAAAGPAAEDHPSPDGAPIRLAKAVAGLATAVAGSPWTRWAFLAAAVVGGGLALAPHRHAVAAAARDIGAVAVLGGGFAAVAGLLATMQVWRVVLAGLGSGLPPVAAAKVFFVGQLGKYVPGSVWPILAQMELARAHRVPRHRTGTAALLTMVVSLGAGLLTAAATLPAAMAGADRRYLWLLAAVPVVALMLHPACLRAALTVALRVTRRPPPDRPLPGRAVLAATGWAVGSWLLFGLHIWLLVVPLTRHPGPAAAVSVGGFALAWCLGFLLVVAPAGAGARDVVLIALLATQLDTGEAAAVALLSRAVMTVADLVLAGGAATAARRRRDQPQPDAVA
ncbi:lysylphosphatidylglycerol synthase domain-containing protein [Dactylosporangium sp. NPDC000555]|uniref:lysylphosphatidylglycerol synthase domain-containing protein n=1 Tax=Dactylosporangium sp. NPDC000555 TaxID=3154260 RepID=UPI003327FE69